MADQDLSHAGGGDGEAPPADPYASIVYKSQLSPDIREDKTIMEALKDSPKLNDLVKAHAELKARSTHSIVIPKEGTTTYAEDMKKFRADMGLPEKAEEYEFNAAAFKDIDGVEEVVAMSRAKAAELGLTRTQAQKYFESIMGLSKAGRDSMTKARKDAQDSFEPQLLELLGKDQQRVTETKNLLTAQVIRMATIAERVRKGEGEKLVKRLGSVGLLNDPIFALVNAELQEFLGEEQFIDGNKVRQKATKQGKQGNYSPAFVAMHGKKGAT